MGCSDEPYPEQNNRSCKFRLNLQRNDDGTNRAGGTKRQDSRKDMLSFPLTLFRKHIDESAIIKYNYRRYITAVFIEKGLEYTPAFKGTGLQYILFAQNKPELFHLLFMSKTDNEDAARFLPAIDDTCPVILSFLQDFYSMNKEDGKRLYNHLGNYTHKIVFYLQEEPAFLQMMRAVQC